MRRRDFIKAIAGSGAVWPLTVRAQQPARVRIIGATTSLSQDDPEDKARIAAFRQSLQELGWTVGGNVRIEYRYGSGNAERIRKNATELVALAPDVILVTGTPSLEPLLRETRTVPIVFVQIPDPVGAGFVESLSRPGGNATGFTVFDYDIAAKWLELLKEIAPNVTRVALVRDASTSAGVGQWAASQAVASALKLDLRPVNVSDVADIERTIGVFARDANGGMVVTASGPSIVHRDLIITLAARSKLPAIYWERFFVVAGGLISYGVHTIDQYRRAAGYVDRILKGEKPSDLPVQTPTKLELIVNTGTAKRLGITIPQTVLARADEVIE
jgi:putative tryptophan/tyrosine transport system substrate-binding protein